MDNLARRHLDVKTISYDEVTGKGANRIPFEQVARRARHRVRGRGRGHHAAPASTRCIRRSPRDAKLARIYATIEMPVRDVLFRMERNGVLIDARAARRSRAASSASA